MACRTLIFASAVTLALFSLAGCGGGAGADSAASAKGADAAGGSGDAAPPATVAEVDASPGAKLYEQWGCAVCHGQDQAGNRFGPSLRGLAPHWTADDMASYLLKPQSFHDRNDRMREIAKKYNTMVMPAYDHPHADRLELANWVLSLE